MPRRGGRKTPEREAYEGSPAFGKGQRSRAGIEGGTSVPFRGRGTTEALVEGRERCQLLAGAAVLANDLTTIASLPNEQREMIQAARSVSPRGHSTASQPECPSRS